MNKKSYEKLKIMVMSFGEKDVILASDTDLYFDNDIKHGELRWD